MRRLLVFNLATDADDPVLGFTTVWINALAQHADHVDVLTMRMGRLAVAYNVSVYSVGREKGYSEARRVPEFYRILAGLLRDHAYDACFAHMQPLFAVMGWPLLRLRHVPVTLWYAHKSVTFRLRLAEKLVDHIVTSSPEGFRLASRKVVVVGQGIDTETFSPALVHHNKPFTMISVSRIAPVKRLETMIESAHLLAQDGPAFRLQIVGEADPQHRAYQQHLYDLVERYDLSGCIEFVGALPYNRIPERYQQADVMLNDSSTGSVDKAVLEAMSCGLPVLTANEAFTPILQNWKDLLLIPPASATVMAQRIKQLSTLSVDQRRVLGAELRQVVVENHSLERLVTNLLAVCVSPPSP